MASIHFNDLNPAELERLAILSEELGEAQQIVGKILRHGYRSVNPTLPPSEQLSNRRLLEIELGHVEAAMTRMEDSKDILPHEIAKSCSDKLERIKKYLHHQ